jgi:hypothetical protein
MSNNFQKDKTYIVGVASPDRRHSRTKLKNVKFDETKTYLQKLGSYFIELGVKNPHQYLEENPDSLDSKSIYEVWEYNQTENVYDKILSSMPSEVTNQIEYQPENSNSNSNNRLEGLSEKLIDIQQETYEKNLTLREEQHEREVESLRMQIEMLQNASNGTQAPFLDRMADSERNFKEMLIQKDNIITQLNDKIYNLQTEYLQLASEKARLEASLEKEKELSDLRKDLEEEFGKEQEVTLGRLDEYEAAKTIPYGEILKNLSAQPAAGAALEKIADMLGGLFSRGNTPPPPPNYGYAPPQQPYYQGQPNPYEVVGGQEQINVDYEALYKQAQDNGAVQPPPLQNIPNY